MITVGFDIGTQNIRAVIMKDGQVIGKAMVSAEFDTKTAINKAYRDALHTAGIQRSDAQKIVATGAGRKECDFANRQITEVTADVKGITYLMPEVQTVVDVGAEESKAIRIGAKGKVIDYAMNDKCAAGTGSFVEAIAIALETEVENMAELYDQSTQEIQMDAQCAIFAESEVVSLIHSQTAKADIARAVLDAIGERTVSMIKRVGTEESIAAIGGMALNDGFIKAIEKKLNLSVAVPSDPQYVSAVGAAIIAAD